MIRAVTAIALCTTFPLVVQAINRARLDACEQYLGNGYERCKLCMSSDACNAEWTTDKCQLPWRETYGAFADRRLEESAAPIPLGSNRKAFVGLNRLKPVYQVAGGK